MKMKFHHITKVLSLLAVFCFCQTPVVLGQKIISGEEAVKIHATNVQNAARTNKKLQIPFDLLKRWEQMPYQKISSEAAFSNYIANVKKAGDVKELTGEQEEKLNHSLVSFFRAYHDGNERVFFDFRTPPGPKWELSPGALNQCIASGKVPTNQLTYENLRSFLLKEETGGESGYENFWQGACLDPEVLVGLLGDKKNSFIPEYGVTIHKSKRFSTFYSDINEPYRYLIQKKYLKPDESKSDAIPEVDMWPLYWRFTDFPAFEETPTMLEMFKESGYLLFADIHCFVNRSTKPPCPVLVRFYWNPQLNVWIPEGFATGAIQKIWDYMGEKKELF